MIDDENAPSTPDHLSALRMVSDIIIAYLGKNPMPTGQVPDLIATVHQSLLSLGSVPKIAAEPLKPAISIKRSVTPEYIVCLEDGKKLKMLKRHLRSAYDLSPDAYRSKWGLPPDYPMVAPNYSEQRSAFAKKFGLGRKAGEKPARRGRRKGA